MASPISSDSPSIDEKPQSDGQAGWLFLAWLLVFLTAVVARLLHMGMAQGEPVFLLLQGDASGYHQWALRLAAGDWWGDQVFYQAPLYPYFLGVIYTVFGESTTAVRAVQVLLVAISCVFMVETGRRWFSLKAGVLAGLMLALFPPAVYYTLLLQKPALMAPLLTGLLACLAAAGQHDRWRSWGGAGVMLGLLALTRENSLILTPAVLAWALWPARVEHKEPSISRSAGDDEADDKARDAPELHQPWLRSAWRAGLVVVGMLLVLLPVAARNNAVGGGFHLTTSQLGTNLFIGNNPDANGLYRPLRWGRAHPRHERADAVAMAEEAEGRELTSAEVSSYWAGRVRDYVRDQPLDWLALMGRKALLTWNRVEVADTDDYYTHANQSYLWLLDLVFHFGVLTPLAALGAVVLGRRLREVWVLPAMLLLYAAGVVLFYIMGRYRFPLGPMLILLAAGGLVMLPAWWRASNWSWRSGACAITLIVAVLVNLPLVPRSSMRATAELNLAIRLMQSPSWLEQAHGHAVNAVSLNPQSGPAHLALGRTFVRLGDFDAAGEALEKAAALLPADDDAALKQAEALAELAFAAATHPDAARRQPEEAARWGELAIRYSKGRDPQAMDAYAAALAHTGDFEQAIVWVKSAHTLAVQQGQAELANKIDSRRQAYKKRDAWVQLR